MSCAFSISAAGSVSPASGQLPSAPPSPQRPTQPAALSQKSTEEILERHFVVNFIDDQKAIWTSPLHLKKRDLFWLVPSAALIGESLHRDAYMYRKLTPAINSGARSKTLSDVAVVGLAGGVAGMYFLGRWGGNDHQRETAVLATEALANSMTAGYALKNVLQRDRPFNTGRGDFFTLGGGTSFPSGHALAAWSMASVIAHEYPGPLTKLGVYGLATAVSVARVTGRQHFPTDVLVGSAIGWGIGTMTYRKHHDGELGPGKSGPSKEENQDQSERQFSVFIPLDSTIYSKIARLAALNLIHSDFSGMRPWTIQESLRLTEEAETNLSTSETQSIIEQGQSIVESLREELLGDKSHGHIRVDSIYARYMGISGVPITDGYHFAQTVYNDYGRPEREGSNVVSGIKLSTSYSRWSAYLSGEYQASPGASPLSVDVRQEIANIDRLPILPATPFPPISQFRFLDTYVALNLDNWQMSVGKQSLWWASNESGSLMFSDNAEPILMVRINRIRPAILPGFLSLLGPLRFEAFLGQLSGQHFIKLSDRLIGPGLRRQPFIDGAKLSFKLTPNFEFGVSFTTVFGDPGQPLRFDTFLRSLSFYSCPSSIACKDPGDRRSGFNFKYRIPKLRDWVTIYNDSMSEDEISPIGYPRRSAMQPGIYLSHIPRIPKLDLRVEAPYTDIPGLRGVGVFYNNGRYADGYRNHQYLLGDWIGRQGIGLWMKSTYWFSANKNLGFGYRNMKVSDQFLTGGGRLSDYSAESNWQIGRQYALKASCQIEHWNMPILSTISRMNVVSSVELRFAPRLN